MSSDQPIVNETDWLQLIQLDPLFKEIHEAYGPPPNWHRPPGFISLCRIILEQQVSLASANAHFLKLDGYLPAFTPEHILALSDEEMRQCQISRQKSRYLKALSTAILEGQIELESLSALNEHDIRAHLIRIPGIGVWTSDVYLMFCLQAKDIFPLGDIAIIRATQKLTGLACKEAISDRSIQWKPLRTLASFYLWHYYLRSRNRPSTH